MTSGVRKKYRNPNPPRGRAPGLSDRDMKMMNYIWMWKLASTASIHEATNRENSAYSTYKVLVKLEQNGWVECRFEIVRRFYVWQLTELGFESIKRDIGDLSEDGFLSENLHHDRLVQAFHLGEWSSHQFPHVKLFTEQQMRRFDVAHYPTWLPQTKEHWPDGYTLFESAKKSWLYAYEVELSPKSLVRYESAIRFYCGVRQLDRVLWLVASPFIKSQILRAKDCVKDTSTNYHLFLDLEDYQKNGWDAAVTNERSETLFTLRQKYGEMSGDLFREILGKFQGSEKVVVHLENPKVIGKSRTYREKTIAPPT